MGLRDLFRRKALTATPAVLEAVQNRRFSPYPILGGTNVRVSAAYQRGMSATYGWIYKTQPAVRSVVDFIARNSAQLAPPKLYERVSDSDRQRLDDHPAAALLDYPDGRSPGDSVFYRLITDYLIYENAYFLKFRPVGGNLTLLRIPPDAVTMDGGRFSPNAYWVWNDVGDAYRVDPESMIHWYGYSPEDSLLGLSKLETLRQELAADRAIQETLVELAKNNMKGGYIRRGLDAPDASQEDLQRIAEWWRAGKLAGDPILDEGMEYVQTGITPKDADVIASRQFSKAEVRELYGVPAAAMGGEGDPAEQRKLVYADVLPPYLNPLANVLNAYLLRDEFGATDCYFEFDLNEKLRGDPETRYAALTSAVGRPWMLVEEARSKENLPDIEGGDELTIPLNVMLAGDQGETTNPQLPAPNVMPPQNPNGNPQDGSYRESALVKAVPGAVPPENRITQYLERRKVDMAYQRRFVSRLQQRIHGFYERQATTLRSKGVFNDERWNAELTKELRSEFGRQVELEATRYAAVLGGEEFDMRQVEHWIDSTGAGVAKALNQVTQRDLRDGTPIEAIERAMNQRAAVAGANLGARVTVFARREAAKQSPTPHLRMQTWIADTKRHADLDGASVPLGQDWGGIEPGSEPNCACSVAIY